MFPHTSHNRNSSCFSGDDTSDDQFLTYRKGTELVNQVFRGSKISCSADTNIFEYSPPDMTFFGLLYCARALATQYGDGEALLEFWKESLYWYNRLGKVGNDPYR